MQVKTIRRDGTIERSVLIGMIMNKTVLGTIAGQWTKSMFPAPWSNIIADWCIDHYQKYNKPPKEAIRGYFAEASQRLDRDTTQLVGTLLETMEDEFARIKHTIDPQYLIDKASKLFEAKRLKDMADRVSAALELGDVDKARAETESFRRVELGMGSRVMVLTDPGAPDRMLAAQGQAIIQYDGALGNFFSTALARDSLVSFMSKEKGGKSFWLLDMAFRALQQGRKVAYFETGDNSEPQVLARMFARITGRPVKADRYRLPISMEPWGGGRKPPLIEFDDAYYDEPIQIDEINEARARIVEEVGDNWALSCGENSSVSVHDIRNKLENWELDGFRPDVIVVDYADILKPLDGRAETRDQINANWKALRALSQRTHALVLTATQTDAGSYETWLLSRGNFSEDKRKYAHVNGMIGINQIASEKVLGVCRLNWIVLRELEFSEERCVCCVGNLGYANPAMLSTF